MGYLLRRRNGGTNSEQGRKVHPIRRAGSAPTDTNQIKTATMSMNVTNLVKELSSVFVFGSRRNRAGALNGPKPRAVPAATLTEYFMPAVRFASSMDGLCESTVMLVRTREKLPPSNPLTMI